MENPSAIQEKLGEKTLSSITHSEKKDSVERQHPLASEILSSIAKQGLLPKKLRKENPCLLSGDKNKGGVEFVSINEINLNRLAGSLKAKLLPLAFEMSAGIYPICLERPYKISPIEKSELQAEFSNRCQNSVLLIFKPQVIAAGGGIKKAVYPDNLGPSYDDLISFHECRILHRPVPIQDLLAVLAPPAFETTAKSIFTTVPFIPVNTIKSKVSLPLYEVQHYWPSKFIKDEVRVSLNVPDYLQGLEAFVTSQKQNHFSCHVVRLPTLKDVGYHLQRRMADAADQADNPEPVTLGTLSSEKKQEQHASKTSP